MKRLIFLLFFIYCGFTIFSADMTYIGKDSNGVCSKYVKFTKAMDADSELLQGIAHDTDLANWVDTLRGEISGMANLVVDTPWNESNWTSVDSAPSQYSTQAALLTRASASVLSAHMSDTDNPHEVTATQLSLGNVDNTSDMNKPISTATQNALDAKYDTDSANEALSLKADASVLSAHMSDTDNPHEVTATQIGLGSVDNTSDTDKPISAATQAALDLKMDADSPAGHNLRINGIDFARRDYLDFVGDFTGTDSPAGNVTQVTMTLPEVFSTTFTSSNSDTCVWDGDSLRVEHNRNTLYTIVTVKASDGYTVWLPKNDVDSCHIDLDFRPIGGNASVTGTWSVVVSGPNGGTFLGGAGDVTGPTGATDGNVALFDGSTGKTIKDSGLTLSGSNTGDETDTSIKAKIGAASSTDSGYLTSTDWSTFNGKMTNPMTTSGDIIYADTDHVPTRLAKGTDGQVLTLASGFPSWATSSGGGGGMWDLVERWEADTIVSSKTFTGLNGNSDIRYRIVFNIVSNVNGAYNFYAQPNADSTSGNYHVTTFYVLASSGVVSPTTNTIGFTICNSTAANYMASGECTIYAKSGHERQIRSDSVSRQDSTRTYILIYGGSWTNTADNITSLKITHDQASAFGVGSSIELWKVAQ